MKHPHQTLRAAAAVLLLAGCSDTGTRDSGIEAELHATIEDAAGTQAGEHAKTFRRSDGMRIDLQLGLANLVPVELVPCAPTTTAMLRALGDSLIGTASAHGSAAEVGGIVDVKQPAGTRIHLGGLLPAPGDYCGVLVELQPGAVTDKHGGELDTGMAGTLVNVAPCYYPDTVGLPDPAWRDVTEHHCIQARAQTAARAMQLDFPQPVRLDGTQRALDIEIAAHYETWFDGLDMTTLADSAEEQSRLLDNVLGSLAVHEVSAGAQ